MHLFAITAAISVALAAEVQLERYLFGEVTGLFFAAAITPIFWGVVGWLIFHRNVGVILFLLVCLYSVYLIDYQIAFHSRWSPTRDVETNNAQNGKAPRVDGLP